MTKKLRLLIVMLSCITLVKAQTSGGPDTYGYIWRDNNDAQGPAVGWIDVASLPGATLVTGLADDNKVGPFSIPFTFQYYWYTPATFFIGSNGYIMFNGTQSLAHPFPLIPSPALPQDFIAPMACDLTFTDPNGAAIPGAECWRYVSAGNDSLIVSWVNVPFWDPIGFTGSNSFQIILTSNDSSITFNYLTQTGVYTNPTDFVSIGIENNSGSIGLEYAHDILPVPPYAIKYYAPVSTSLAISDAATSWCNNTDNGALFLSKGGIPYTMNAEVNNAGNQSLVSFNVNSVVRNSSNVIQAQGNFSVSNLSPAQSQLVTFPQTFTPTIAGTFRHINTTQLPGDATPGNDVKTLELQVVDTTTASIILSYDNGVAGTGALSWQGGNGGAANLFYPPFYPCQITKARAFISANANLVGMSLQVYDDDGPNSTPLTQLDSVYIDGASVIVGSWNEVIFTTPIQITSGGFYVAWVMDGDGITIATTTVAPFSNRSFEILGDASSPINWADYRNREVEDMQINATITTVPVGLNEIVKNENSIGDFYPNPVRNNASINCNVVGRETISYAIYDLSGKLIKQSFVTSKASGETTFEVKAGSIEAGVYLCKINIGKQVFERKLVVVK